MASSSDISGLVQPEPLTEAGATDLLRGFVSYPERLVERYRAAGLWSGRPLWSHITESAVRFAHCPAVTDDTRSLSFGELVREADGIAAGLRDAGFGAGERIVLHMNNGIDFAVLFLAALRAGLVPVLALPAHRAFELRHLGRLSGASALFTDASPHATDDWLDEVARDIGSLRHLFRLTEGLSGVPLGRADGFVPPLVATAGPALLLVSGGTTGAPKLIARTHEDYAYNAQRSAEVCRLTPQDTYLAVLPAAHNFALACPGLLGALMAGAHTVFSRNSSPDHCFALIARHRVTMVALVPALAQVWTAALAWENCLPDTLRLIQVGGARLAEADARTMMTSFRAKLQQVFGMAEGLICYTELDADADTIAATQGRPMSPWDEVRVVDAAGGACGPGEIGELLVRGPYTLRGYYRASDANADAMSEDGFYRSGDHVIQRADGYLIVAGRSKDVVNRGGESISASEVEAAISTHPVVRQVAVVALPDAHLGERIGAALVCVGNAPTLAQLRDHLIDHGLAAYKLPERLCVLPALPLTAVGKIDKKRLLPPDTQWQSFAGSS